MSITTLHPRSTPGVTPFSSGDRIAPYAPGDQVLVTGADGTTHLAVVEDITLTRDGKYSLFAQVVRPAQPGSYLICTPVSAEGTSDVVRSA